MSRVAIERNPASYGGMSRLPRPVGQGQLGTYQSKLQNGPTNGQKPSRLEMMQAEFQKNILKEKEQKMISMYEENQQKALQRVNHSNNSNNKGMVRDFFRERRQLGSGNSQNQNQPTMEHMFNRKKLEHKKSNGSMGRTQSYNGNYAQKQSAGRDRSNLLAPINGAGKNGSPANPFPHKAQIVRPRTYKDVSSNNANIDHKPLPMSAPTGAMMSDNSSDDSPPPNPKQLQMLQQKRMMLKNQRNNVTQITRQPGHHHQQQQKKTDFQKWQEEQDQNRANRLKKHQETKTVPPQNYQTYVDDEGYDGDSIESDEIDPQEEMKRKQVELLRQIEDQQRELERLRNERMQEEIEEKKEKARRRKKMEEERQRREKEEEEYRRKMEEEDRIKRTFEEEKQKKIAEEKERLRKQSQTSGFEYEESDDEEQNYNHRGYKRPSPSPQKHRPSPQQQQQYKPSAPSKPKPSNTRKYHPPQSRTPPQRESPPLVKGDHTAMYRNADQQEGAFENIGNLVSCYNCGRNFAADRIEKHEKFCKNLTKKRKVLDPTKLRTQGTEMAQYVGSKQPNPKGRKGNQQAKKNNWREKHESFINAIKYAKKCKQIEEQGGSLADLPPPPRSENPDYVQCPYCTRRFNPQTAERHIPHCKNTKSRPAPPKRR